jgi:indolepyruvate ferredoxin oxidoreductase
LSATKTVLTRTAIASGSRALRPWSSACVPAAAIFWTRSRATISAAYKDEYEVARLHTESGFIESVKRSFGEGARMSFHFSPPLFARLDRATGRPKKYELGPWVLPFLRMLAKLRWLRGTKLDLFGLSADRRLEREQLARYEALLDRVADEVDESRFELAVELAALPSKVRGYGPIKSAAAAGARDAERALWVQWDAPAAAQPRARASAA